MADKKLSECPEVTTPLVGDEYLYAVQNAESKRFPVSSLMGAANPTYTNPEPSVIAVGGIPAGTVFADKSLTDIFDTMLYPELFPSLSNPSSSFSMTASGLMEVGIVIPTLTCTTSFNKGSISPAYGTTGFRSGSANTYIYTGVGMTTTPTIASAANSNARVLNNYSVDLGAQTWTACVAYDAGPQPKSSKGNNYSTPLPLGITAIGSSTITGVYPFFATTASIGMLTKQALVYHNASYFAANMVAESGADKQKIQVPQAFNPIVGIQFYNTVSSAWEWIGGNKANSLTVFTKTSDTVNGVAYWTYTHNSSAIGARQLRFYTV